MKIYMAHPISGGSGPDIFDYYEVLAKTLSSYYETLCPMTGKDYLRTEVKYAPEGYKFPASTDKAIKERDQWMVSQADIVLVDFTGAKAVSIGCCMELAWADMLRKHTVVVIDKIHKHAFVTQCADIVFATLEEATAYLFQLAIR
jgi:nucleoside 2-deoxyribosyltransferase